MTIAAGLLYEGGVLICADTLMSSNTMGIYESKLMVIHSEDGKAVFGMAGDDIAFAEAAVQHCRSPLIDYRGAPRTVSQLAATIETVLAREFKQHVIDNQLFYTHNYNFVIAIHSKVDGVGLFVTDATTMKRTRRGFECVGSGHDLAHYLIGPIYDLSWTKGGKRISGERAFLLAVRAMANIRAFMPGSVGGDPIILVIEANGTGHAVGAGGYFHLMESCLKNFEYNATSLFLRFFDPAMTKEALHVDLVNFSSAIEQLRDNWKNDQETLGSKLTSQGFPLSRIELQITLDLAVPTRPSGSKRGRRPRRPSQESPGASNES